MNSPYQATQLEVDAGIVSDKFVTPSTFYNSSKWDSIPTDITIGTTPITSGVAGRVLFEGAGNVVQEDSGLFWNNTNKILTTFRSGAGTGPIFRLNVGSSDVSKLQFTQELSVGVPTEIGYISNQFGTGMILNSFNSIYFNANNAEKMRIVSGTGNILINTTTDNGGKLQVKASGALSTDIAFRVRNSADTDDLMLVNGLGNVGIGTNAPNSRLHLSGSTTTSSAIARGGNITPTLVASANNDILVGLDIAPTFTNGAFTGVTNTALRLIFSGTGTGVGNYLSFTNIAGYPTINSGGQISINAQNSTVFYADAGSTSIFGRSLSSNINFQLSNTIIGRFFNTTGNLLLQNGGTFTDNGYKLDVNGTQRVQGLSSLNSVVINNTVLNASAVLQADSTIQGFLPPRMTTTQKNAIATPAAGLIVYDTTTNKACCYNGTSWNDLF